MTDNKLKLEPGSTGKETTAAIISFLSRSESDFTARGVLGTPIRRGKTAFEITSGGFLPLVELRMRRRDSMPVYARVMGVEPPGYLTENGLWCADMYLPTPEYGRDRRAVLDTRLISFEDCDDERPVQRDVFGGGALADDQAFDRLAWFAQMFTQQIGA